LDEAIAEYCPDGVEFRSVSAASVPVSMPGKVKREDYGLGSEFPIVDQSLDYIAGYTDKEAIVVPAADYVVFGDHTRALKFIDFAFAQGADGVKVLQATDGLSTKWLYYCLSSLEIPSRGYNRHWTVLRDLRIPVPPPRIQQEIVSILDQMEDLRTGLEAELEARRQQFEYYRDLLLSFRGRGVPWVPLRELGHFIRGKRFTKRDYDAGGVGCIHYGEIYTHYGTSARSVVSRVRSDLAPTLRFAEPGDVVVVDVGETVEDVGKAVAWLGSEPVAIHDHTYAFRHDLNPTFVSYVMQTAAFQAQRTKFIARTKVKTLLIEGFSRIAIPVPPRDEQERIVAILDRFDALVNDLSIGLPAELNARRQQYEHYRYRLLTFPGSA
jgi:type I restriction enzyme S subunit